MDVHTPKPWRGGRELAKEIGTIVLGVLIALGAEQTVEALNWAHKARLAEGLMREEIAGDDGPQVYIRIATLRCQRQQLTELRAMVEDGAAREALVPRVQAFRATNYGWDSAALRAADSSGALVHLPHDLLSDLSQFYELMPTLNVHTERESAAAAHLHALSAKGGPLSDAERQTLLTAIEELSDEHVWIRANVLNAADAMYRAHIKLDPVGQTVFEKTLDQFWRPYPQAAACLARGLDDLKQATSKNTATRYFVDPPEEFKPPAAPRAGDPAAAAGDP